MYVYGLLRTNTNMIFHTCDGVVGSRGCVLYIRVGGATWLLHGFHYLFISYLFVSLLPCIEV